VKVIVAIRALELRKMLDVQRGMKQLTFRFDSLSLGSPSLTVESRRMKRTQPVVSLTAFPNREEAFAFTASGRKIPELSGAVDWFVPRTKPHKNFVTDIDPSDVMLLELEVDADAPFSNRRRKKATLTLRSTAKWTWSLVMNGWFTMWALPENPWMQQPPKKDPDGEGGDEDEEDPDEGGEEPEEPEEPDTGGEEEDPVVTINLDPALVDEEEEYPSDTLVQVTIVSSDVDSSIVFTLNGAEPTLSDVAEEGGPNNVQIQNNGSVVVLTQQYAYGYIEVKARAVKNGALVGETAVMEINWAQVEPDSGTIPTVTIALDPEPPAGGSYDAHEEVEVTISSDPKAAIVYTINEGTGIDPTLDDTPEAGDVDEETGDVTFHLHDAVDTVAVIRAGTVVNGQVVGIVEQSLSWLAE